MRETLTLFLDIYMTQSQALSILKTGANVFLTGEPGSGKTYTINEYTAYLRGRGIESLVQYNMSLKQVLISNRG